MAPPPAARGVLTLLRELRSARSPLAKARLLARAARQVRQMNRAERLRLVTVLGAEKAEELVDGVDEFGDTGAKLLLQDLLGRVKRTGPEEWKELAWKLREPAGRRELAEKGLELLAGEPEAQEPEPEEEPTGEAPDEEMSGEDLADEEVLGEEAPGEQVPGEQVPGEERPVGEPSPRGPLPEELPLEDGGPGLAVAPPGPPPAAAESPPVPTTPEPPAVEPAAPAAVEPAVPPPAEAAEPLLPAPAKRPGGASTLRELTRLRRRLDGLREADEERLRRLVLSFGAGWPRRRALVALLRAGVPAELGPALRLVESTQDEPVGRLWCLSALAERSDLSEADRRRLLDSAAAGPERRRIAARLVTATGERSRWRR